MTEQTPTPGIVLPGQIMVWFSDEHGAYWVRGRGKRRAWEGPVIQAPTSLLRLSAHPAAIQFDPYRTILVTLANTNE